ncbi:hypothetical protein Pmi06nite_22230 [Planotetraspora mira]|uniref:Uncharacterized protein n=1 Tax=Planotetraspora mira TaxID=58121 RepID=A0A8J3TMX0_9ACTN|nr:hypothetical protein Pmi06nite_22230 [Planotetraspora mira]
MACVWFIRTAVMEVSQVRIVALNVPTSDSETAGGSAPRGSDGGCGASAVDRGAPAARGTELTLGVGVRETGVASLGRASRSSAKVHAAPARTDHDGCMPMCSPMAVRLFVTGELAMMIDATFRARSFLPEAGICR